MKTKGYAGKVTAELQTTRTSRTLLRLVRALQPVSRIELSRRLKINRSKVTDIFNPLIAANLLREETLPSSPPQSSRAEGRPPIGIS